MDSLGRDPLQLWLSPSFSLPATGQRSNCLACWPSQTPPDLSDSVFHSIPLHRGNLSFLLPTIASLALFLRWTVPEALLRWGPLFLLNIHAPCPREVSPTPHCDLQSCRPGVASLSPLPLPSPNLFSHLRSRTPHSTRLTPHGEAHPLSLPFPLHPRHPPPLELQPQPSTSPFTLTYLAHILSGTLLFLALWANSPAEVNPPLRKNTP